MSVTFQMEDKYEEDSIKDFASHRIAKPSCFGRQSVLNNSASTCQACGVADACANEIELDALLSDLPGDPDENAAAPWAAIPTSAKTSRLPPSASSAGVELTAPVNGDARRVPLLPYAFPVPAARRYEHFSNAALIDELAALIGKGNFASPVIRYSAVRDEMCAVHVEMNLRQQHAPRFRPQPPLPRRPIAGDEIDMARDRQVIDIHWRAHSFEKPLAPVQDYPGIFKSGTFDFETASRFAQLDWKSQTKVVHLRLSEEMQWEHAVLQLSSIRDKWRTIENGDVRGDKVKQAGAPHVESTLRNALSNAPHLKMHIPGLVLTWKAQCLVGGSPMRIAKLVGLMNGKKPRDASAVRRTLASLDGHLKGAPKVPKK